MELIKKLNKPYTKEERNKFIVENNHNLGYKIIENIDSLEAWKYSKEEKQILEKESIKKLHLTKREVFLGLYKAKNIKPEEIRAKITNEDEKIEFDFASEYYRGNPLIDKIGNELGITSEQLDDFFKTKDYKYLGQR